MRTETATRTLYQFEELSESAKETARDWWRGCIEADELADSDDWNAIAEILGIEFKTQAVSLMGGGTRREPCVYWSGFSNQGDGASFVGWYSYAKAAPKRIRDYSPQDTELHRIADELQAVQRRFFYRLQATITRGHGSNFYSHSGTMSVDVSRADEIDLPEIDTVTETVTQLMRDFADWIYRRLESQWEYLHSVEAIDESIIANEYEFTETGEIA